MSDLLGQSAVVTGSSSGIGRAIALELARGGANVLVHCRQSRAAAEDVAAEILALGRATGVAQFDLADESEQEALVNFAWEWAMKEWTGRNAQPAKELTSIDIWVNNAGVDVLTGQAAKWSFEQKLQALWRVDVAASIRLSRSVGQRMKAAGGVILNMGWDQAAVGMAGDSGELFAATKGAVMAFSRSLAKSLGPQVRVNCIAPGWIKTEWGQHASAAWQQRAVRESLLERWGTPEDVARVARFLCSPAAGFVTGEIIQINGGRP